MAIEETAAYPWFGRELDSTLVAREVPRSRRIGDRDFPTRRDYERWAVTSALARNPGGVWRTPRLVAEIQSHWFATGQSGCVFAQHVARHSAGAAWRSFVCPSPSRHDDVGLSRSLDALVGEQRADPQCELVSFLFPATVTETQLVRLIRVLLQMPRVRLASSQPASDLIGISLRINVGAEFPCGSWILGFGPFDCLPATRQAPVTEVVFRAKENSAAHDGSRPVDHVHVADIPLQMPQHRVDALWQASVRSRRAILGNDDANFAKARFSFSLPTRYASLLTGRATARGNPA